MCSHIRSVGALPLLCLFATLRPITEEYGDDALEGESGGGNSITVAASEGRNATTHSEEDAKESTYVTEAEGLEME